jgi:hypothetical protein
MKTSTPINIVLGSRLILLAGWLLMGASGFGTSLRGAENNYCGTYCLIGKGKLLLSLILFLSMFIPELKQFYNYKKNAPSYSKPQNT